MQATEITSIFRYPRIYYNTVRRATVLSIARENDLGSLLFLSVKLIGDRKARLFLSRRCCDRR
jgi:hypothetical protein